MSICMAKSPAPSIVCVGGPHDGSVLQAFSDLDWIAKAMPATVEWPPNQRGDEIRIDKYVKKVSERGICWVWEPEPK